MTTGISAYDLAEHVITPTLKSIEMYSLAAEQLLLATAAQESHMGHYLVQVNGPALGIYQIEPATHHDVWENYLSYRPELAARIKRLVPDVGSNGLNHRLLVSNLDYATAIARLIYYRAPGPLPDATDIEGLAHYWKIHYNTAEGKGRPREFIDNYRRFIG